MKTMIILILLLTSAPQIGSQIYHWVDENGVKHYSTTPPPNTEQVTDVQVQETKKVVESDSEKSSDTKETNSQTDKSAKSIQIYTNSDCSRCANAIAWLDKAGYHYTEYNIDSNRAYYDKFKSYGVSELPLIIIDNDRMSGWQGVMKMVAILGTESM